MTINALEGERSILLEKNLNTEVSELLGSDRSDVN